MLVKIGDSSREGKEMETAVTRKAPSRRPSPLHRDRFQNRSHEFDRRAVRRPSAESISAKWPTGGVLTPRSTDSNLEMDVGVLTEAAANRSKSKGFPLPLSFARGSASIVFTWLDCMLRCSGRNARYVSPWNIKRETIFRRRSLAVAVDRGTGVIELGVLSVN